ncbi:hypothetical protein KUV95_01680 [Microbulbifer agarilyticus]|uniref:hypothetical protein n=1 Tax=Microbulbifer agarilyticus TaxID=260552 RepID=UPI0021BC19CE|nr:hypothetical protein [Microbulbifer agarilyticus]MBY6210252.1 hypothetical protein [Microbulbifer agarilyticus]
MFHQSIDTRAVAVDNGVVRATQRHRLPLNNAAIVDHGFHIAVDANAAIDGTVRIVEDVQIAGAAGLNTLIYGCAVGKIHQSIADELHAAENPLVIDDQVVNLAGFKWAIEGGIGENVDREIIKLPNGEITGRAAACDDITGAWRVRLAVRISVEWE